MSFRATGRWSASSSARYTTPMSPWLITSSTRHPANTEPSRSSGSISSSVGGPAGRPGVRERGRRCAGGGGPGGDRGRRAGAGVARAGAGVARAGGRGGRGRGRLRRTSVNCRVVVPTRTESPSFERRRPRTRSPFTKVPLADPRSSMSPAARVAGDAGVAAGQLDVVAQPPLSAHPAPDQRARLGEAEPAAGATPAVTTSTRPPPAGAPAGSPRGSAAGTRVRWLGHLRRRGR